MTEPKAVLRQALGLAEDEDLFPWQEELLKRFLRGECVKALDIPTGLGKTAVMAIWLVARACGAHLPRRLVYVVDRRAVVDQATEEAMKLRKLVEIDGDLKDSLRLCADRSLPISTLRGQYVDNREWLDDPAAPAIIVGTVDMVGSRLLFEGYGVSRKMRPYHAGLLGADALVVLDEAHLVPAFEHLLRSIAIEPNLQPRDERYRVCVPPFRLLSLSATARTRSADVVALTDRDFACPAVAKRLNARKSLWIEALDDTTKIEDALAKQAWKLTGDGTKAMRVLVYSHEREVAAKAKEAIEKLAKDAEKEDKPQVNIETELLVGGRRVFEREAAKRRLRELGFLAGSRVACAGPVFLFATSAGEVGIDLDADHMVCDLVAWERMVQRFGRVNRRGQGAATVVVIVELKPRADKTQQEALDKRARNEELDGNERRRLEAYERKVREWESRQKWIEHLRRSDDGSYDASPAALRDVSVRAATDEGLQRILDAATTPEPLRPALTRPLVEAWAMTSLEKHTGRPAIQPWLRGWVDDPPQTALVWRTHLPVRRAGPLLTKKEIKEVESFFEAAPAHTSEILETETFQVIQWIAARGESLRKQQAAPAEDAKQPLLREDDLVAFALAPDGRLRQAFTLRQLVPDDRAARDELERQLEGATLVMDVRIGGLKEGLLHPAESDPPRTADDGQEWIGEGVVGFRVRSIDASSEPPTEKNWRERLRFALAVTEEGTVTKWLVVDKWWRDAATEDDRSAAKPQHLEAHQLQAEARARSLARALHLDDTLSEVLSLAARLHDEGKRSVRWQRAFHAPGDGVYAKTEGPIDYWLLDGYRHELGTFLRAERDERVLKLSEEHRDLLLHLIVTHHGFARPVISMSGCEDVPPSALDEKAAEIALRFVRLQNRWGPWGLAWLEALLRAADQLASQDNDLRDASGVSG